MRLADAFSDSTPTVLGIGPMSAVTVRAGLRVAAETGTSAVFIASRNQVESAELGGGYAEGWDQAGLVRFLREQAGRWPGGVQWFVGREDLRSHARCGIGIANVAPEFGHAETAALLDLADLELIGTPSVATSGIAAKLTELVMRSGRAAMAVPSRMS
jgi:hypothetical protein